MDLCEIYIPSDDLTVLSKAVQLTLFIWATRQTEEITLGKNYICWTAEDKAQITQDFQNPHLLKLPLTCRTIQRDVGLQICLLGYFLSPVGHISVLSLTVFLIVFFPDSFCP